MKDPPQYIKYKLYSIRYFYVHSIWPTRMFPDFSGTIRMKYVSFLFYFSPSTSRISGLSNLLTWQKSKCLNKDETHLTRLAIGEL